MMQNKPRMTLSLDLDNQWTYMKTHGDPVWESYPSYLDIAVPRILDFLRQRDIKITFFVVGQDATRDENLEALAQLSADGHEIANHSFNHEPWLHLYSPEQLNDELARAEDAIEHALQQVACEPVYPHRNRHVSLDFNRAVTVASPT